MRNINDVIRKLPEHRQRKIAARASMLVAEEMTLQDLRKARSLTQERMSELLHIGQDSVSRLEKRSDLLLSTLRSYVSAMGGTLELVAKFEDRAPVILASIDDVGDEAKPKKPSRGRRLTPVG
jgi:DNA-binding XRE family transcriptional regulator